MTEHPTGTSQPSVDLTHGETVAILVHGTFAKGAPWTNEATSRLCSAITEEARKANGVIRFEAPEWAATNLLKDRIRAGKELAERVNRLAMDGSRVILIGHSHGGTVVLHALKHLRAPANVIGTVFMATPFVHTRYRNASNSILHWLRYATLDFGPILLALSIVLFAGAFVGLSAGVAFLPLYAFFMCAICPAVWWKVGLGGVLLLLRSSLIAILFAAAIIPAFAFIPPILNLLPKFFSLLAHILVFILGLSVGIWAVNLAEKGLPIGPPIPRLVHAASLTRSEHLFPDISPEKCLIIRAPGDEASAGLGFAQTLDLALGVVLDLPRKWLSYFDPFVFLALRDPEVRRSQLFRRSLIVTCSLLGLCIVVFLLAIGFPGRPQVPIEKKWVYVWVFLIPAIATLPIVCYLLLWLAGVFVARAFGTTRALSVFLLQHLVEAMPVGSWQFEQLDTAEHALPASELDDESAPIAHSVYLHPAAEAKISKWIASRIALQSAA